jgi:5-methylcytosine-specific restriction endonuclease McrA
MTSSTARGYGQAHRSARLIVLARDGYRCHWCGGPATVADHHPIPRCEGGQSTPSNLVASCVRCNAERGAIEGNARRARARVAPHPFFEAESQDPTAVSVLSPDPPTQEFVVT